mgnify:CR=1 FL=1
MPCKGICELDQRVLIAAEVRRDGQFISTRLGAVMGLGVARLLARPSKLPVVTLPSLLLLHTVIFRPGTCGWLNVTRQPWADYTSMWLTPFPPLFSLRASFDFLRRPGPTGDDDIVHVARSGSSLDVPPEP